MKLCLNWKVVGGLALVAIGVWAVAPDLLGAAVSLLLVAACPLSMLLMMRGMHSRQCASESTQTSEPARLNLTCDEEVALLKADLARLQVQQAAIARQIAELEAPTTSAIREAEAVARAADERAQAQT